MVVQVQVRNFDFTGRERFRVNTKAVVLRGDLDLAGEQVLHRMVRAVVAKLKLERLAAQCQAAELVAQTNSENGNSAKQLADVFLRIGDRFGITGSVRKEDAVGPQRQNIFGRGVRGNNGDVAMMINEQAQDVLLDAVIVGHDF